MRLARLAALLVASAALSACSGSDAETGAPERAPSQAEARKAIEEFTLRDLATGPARSVDGCTSVGPTTTCAIDYDHTCSLLAVERHRGKLVVTPPVGRYACVHAEGDLTNAITLDP